MPSSTLSSTRLTFIGGGNMAFAIISGLISSSSLPASQIRVSDPSEPGRAKLANLGVHTGTSNVEAAKGADVVVLAVKPQVARGVCVELAEGAGEGKMPLVVSIAAGITLGSLREWLTPSSGDGKATPHVIRVMPNTPALVGEGASGMFAGEGVTTEEKEVAESLMRSVSKAVEWVEKEELLEVVTGLSGSGPAYFFALVSHLTSSAISLGLPADVATRLAKQTCFGAGKMLIESSETPEQLRKNVTSPNGTTQAALESFERDGFESVVGRAVEAAVRRGEALGREMAGLGKGEGKL